MKTAILYTSRYGATREICERLQRLLPGGADLFDLEQRAGEIPLAQYDRILLGGPVYMGTAPSVLRKFAAQHCGELTSKEIGLFLCGLLPEESLRPVFKASFPAELIQRAKAICAPGTMVRPDQMSRADRLVFKLAGKTILKRESQGLTEEEGTISSLSQAKLEALVEAMENDPNTK